MKVVSTYYENGRCFKILKDSHGYWGVEDKYIVNRRLTRQFNGLTGFLSNSVSEVIEKIRKQIAIDTLVENGVDRIEAVYQIIIGQLREEI